MQTSGIELDRSTAHKLYREYLKHREHQTPVDNEIQRAYHAISKGRVVIRAMQSIIDAGLDDKGRPRLALAPADADYCNCRLDADGTVIMTGDSNAMWRARRSKTRNVQFRAETFARPRRFSENLRAVMPVIPPGIRPARGIENYHVLWEAEWEPRPPRDPILLRRVGMADLWVVCGAWDLTEVERAAMATRVHH